jgi:hypothetical protein
MQFFSGSRTGTQRFRPQQLLRNKALILIISLILVSGLTLVVHAAQVSVPVTPPPFGIIQPLSPTSNNTDTPERQASKLASPSVSVDVTQTSSAATAIETTTSVTVNNETIPVPANGIVTKNVSSDNGKTTINIQSSNQSTNTSSRNSLRIRSSSHSSKSTVTQSTEQINNQGELQL